MSETIELLVTSFWPILKAGLLITIPLTLIAFTLGLLIAVVTALVRLSKLRVLKFFFAGYVWIFRGTPLLVQLFIVFFGLPKAGIEFSAWAAVIITFSLNVGAYSSESIRSAILAIPRGQWEAAYSIGMSKGMVLWRIIAPQALRISVPPLSNTFIGLVKDTSLASSITIVEMFMVGQQIASRTYEPLLLYSLVAAIYLVFCTFLTVLQGKLEIATSKHIRK